MSQEVFFPFFVIALLVVYVIHMFGISGLVKVTEAKGFELSGLICALRLFSGVPAYLLVIALPDRRVIAQNEAIIELLKSNAKEQKDTDISLPTI